MFLSKKVKNLSGEEKEHMLLIGQCWLVTFSSENSAGALKLEVASLDLWVIFMGFKWHVPT